MAESSTDRSKACRKRMKAKGYVSPTVWVHKSNVAKIKDIVDKINKGECSEL